jgi:hypothetical protein
MGADHRSMVVEDRMDLLDVLGTLSDAVGAGAINAAANSVRRAS